MKVSEILNKIGFSSDCDIVVMIYDEYDGFSRTYDITKSMLKNVKKAPFLCSCATLNYFVVSNNQMRIYGRIKR